MPAKVASKMKTKPKKHTVRMMLTCIGRRVELLRAFRRAGDSLGINLEIHGADASRTSPAMHLVDKTHIVPKISTGKYISTLIEIVRKRKIDLLLPTIDSELMELSEAVERFAEIGCLALVSKPEVISICRDKIETFEALTAAGIDTPKTWRWKDICERKTHKFPYFMKPCRGSASVGNYKIHNKEELLALGGRVPDPIVQEFISGEEHTMDVYTGLDGVPRVAVPRKRLEVRTGEVSKGLVVKDPKIMDSGMRVAKALGACRGVVTVQCMVTPKRRMCIIEINPRFGGGAPLAIHAGADFPKWILSELIGKKPRINATGFKDDIAMLRFDDSVFVKKASKVLELR